MFASKTPEQIAEDIYAPVHEEWAWALGRRRLIPLMVAAIEADRAQRADALDALHAWAVNVSYSLGTDKSNDWAEELAELAEIEREYGLVDDDADPTSDPDAEDYGKYLDQQFWGDH